MKKIRILGLLGLLSVGTMAFGQGAQVPFGGLDLKDNSTVQITADSLSIDQNANTAIFTGSVIAGIENMRLSADKIEVVYSDTSTGGQGPISQLLASGHVVFSNGDEAAEADFATFDLDSNDILMTGNVILTQGNNALSGQKLRINLETGIAVVEGRVQTIFQTGTSE